jgi:putative transposase
VRYAWIQEHAGEYPVAGMTKALDVSRGGYYEWTRREPSETELRRERIAHVAEKFHERSKRIYGYRKVYEDIVDEEPDISCCRETVRRIMNDMKLFSRVKRRFVKTTDSDHDKRIAANVLDRDFAANGPNEKWSADITYVPTREGWLYLAVVMDLWSRRIVGWSMSENIDAKLVSSALKSAIRSRRPGGNLTHHSDRGVQYASDDFQKVLEQHRIECSMSRKGDCWDNAPSESFFGKLKGEWIRKEVFADRNAARESVFEYIEVFYNRIRRHASLGYVSPADFEARADNQEAA